MMTKDEDALDFEETRTLTYTVTVRATDPAGVPHGGTPGDTIPDDERVSADHRSPSSPSLT